MERESTRAIGRDGEEIAAEYLRNNGYRIVEKNYKNRFGEIDIIAKDGNTVVFIEVKTRNTPSYGTPSSAVDSKKQQRMGKVAVTYLIKKRLTHHPVRFDVVSICDGKIEVIRDAFELREDFSW